MPEYLNNSTSTVYLMGPDNKSITLRRGEKANLSDYFDIYVKRGYIIKIEGNLPPPPNPIKNRRAAIPNAQMARVKSLAPAQFKPSKGRISIPSKIVTVGNQSPAKQIVGRQTTISATALVQQANTQFGGYPINNGIGIGILSYNRLHSLERCVESILRTTNLHNINVFISDDASDDTNLLQYLATLDPRITVLLNSVRAGVAGNTNRLLQCLTRFKHKFLLNDDVEILNGDTFKHYIDTAGNSSIHHLMKHQVGVYGGKPGTPTQVNFQPLVKIDKKPQGAFIYLDDCVFNTVGFFDERFGLYGQEHIDYSDRVAKSGIQPVGYFDTPHSDNFVKIYSDKSAVSNKAELLKNAKSVSTAPTVYVDSQHRKSVPCISVIIPFRDHNRDRCLPLVINNIIGQSYPDIKIYVTEHDTVSKITGIWPDGITFLFTPSNGRPFNKSKAFNHAFKQITTDKMILHDADTLATATYIKNVADILDRFDSCHICNNISYTTRETTNSIIDNRMVSQQVDAERVIAYFEGGSLGMTKSAYVKAGGFHEGFEGYGCFCPDNNFVLTNNGYKPIQEVVETDKVYTHTGHYRALTLRQRPYNGTVLDIYVPGRLPIKGVTPEHPFLVETSKTEMMWIKACDIKPGMKIATTDHFPELIPNYDFNDILRCDKSKNKWEVNAKMPEFSYLMGLYLAEGVIQSPSKLRTTYMFLSKQEQWLAQRVSAIVSLLHPNINVNYDYVKNNCMEVRIFNSVLAKTIHAIAGKRNAKTKILSTQFIESLSDDNRALLLGGMIDGDGSHGFNSTQRKVYHTNSINLAMQTSGIMRRMGIAHSFGTRKGGSFAGSSRFGFDLTVNREFEHLIKSAYNHPVALGSSSWGRTKFGEVFDVKEREYSGMVYNFEVEIDKSYVVNGLHVHNCEDNDFYARLSQATNFFGERNMPLIHLWHDRPDGWETHHNKNIALEKELKTKTIPERLLLQRAYIK